MLDYNKWLNPKIKIQSEKVAISAIPAIQELENSRNSRNSNNSSSNVIDFKNLDIEKLKIFLAKDWELYKNNTQALHCWANLLHERQLMEQGVVPGCFTATTHCACCGDVFVLPEQSNNGSVLGCPWCWNNARGLPIPNAKNLRGVANEL